MSDDLDIRGGGAVAVDTATLITAADRFTSVSVALDEACALIGSAGSILFASSHLAWAVCASVDAARTRVLGAQRTSDAIAADLRRAAAVYETIELRAEREIAASSGDQVAMARLSRRLDALAREYPDAAASADDDVHAHWLRWPAELAGQAPGALWWLAPGFGAVAGPSAWGIQRALGAAGVGAVPRSARLTGAPQAVTVTPVAGSVVVPVVSAAAASAPASLADAAARMPGGGDARIRVERYAMPDGTRQFAVYVAGTQTVLPRTDDPFDMRSNIELYGGERSASYDAALEALAQSGARTGDVVHAFGHSQGAMVTAHLALEGGYDTRTLVTFGSPIEVDPGADTLSVALRHRDDPVAALTGGGHEQAVGAPGSFIAERTADPAPGLQDWQLPAHGMDGYLETAELLDASSDPRMTAVRNVFDDLAGARTVQVTEYSATRVSPSSSDAG